MRMYMGPKVNWIFRHLATSRSHPWLHLSLNPSVSKLSRHLYAHSKPYRRVTSEFAKNDVKCELDIVCAWTLWSTKLRFYRLEQFEQWQLIRGSTGLVSEWLWLALSIVWPLQLTLNPLGVVEPLFLDYGRFGCLSPSAQLHDLRTMAVWVSCYLNFTF